MHQFNVYQRTIEDMARYPGAGTGEKDAISYVVMGLTGEAGEVADKYKKVLRDDEGVLHEEKRLALALELGDVLWYVARLAEELNYDLSDVATMNVEKLKGRLENNTINGSGDNR